MKYYLDSFLFHLIPFHSPNSLLRIGHKKSVYKTDKAGRQKSMPKYNCIQLKSNWWICVGWQTVFNSRLPTKESKLLGFNFPPHLLHKFNKFVGIRSKFVQIHYFYHWPFTLHTLHWTRQVETRIFNIFLFVRGSSKSMSSVEYVESNQSNEKKAENHLFIVRTTWQTFNKYGTHTLTHNGERWYKTTQNTHNLHVNFFLAHWQLLFGSQNTNRYTHTHTHVRCEHTMCRVWKKNWGDIVLMRGCK